MSWTALDGFPLGDVEKGKSFTDLGIIGIKAIVSID
jgi:hypothetical protein